MYHWRLIHSLQIEYLAIEMLLNVSGISMLTEFAIQLITLLYDHPLYL